MSEKEGKVIPETNGMKRPRFDPVKLGLPEEFTLTDYTRLKGCSCKVPQPELLALLQSVSTTPGRRDVGMDCSIVKLQHKDETGKPLYMVSTTDFFFPSVEDPYLQGQIGAANVLSDLYSTGIDRCDTVLMLLAASTDMDKTEREVCTQEMMKGFVDHVRLAGSDVTGGQTVMNPWPLIGGIATSVVAESQMIRPTGLQPGDILVLTKPLGCQIAVNLKQWLRRPSPIFEEQIQGKMDSEEIEELYNAAADGMKRLNRMAAALMHSHGAHGATDVTGFGILGHAKNLGSAQKADVCLVLDSLPMYRGAVKASKLMGDKYRLFEGYAAETSGGLLVAFGTREEAEGYIRELYETDGEPAWVVGRVVRREGSAPYALLQKDYKIIEVGAKVNDKII
ncbi:selenophosphate synthetase, putative [Trypanosoma equiperdum]|uniref:Selenide, water dikinase n=2 Tax=Trypanozoon TaxID=39700 RepID=SPS2_TRYB2|nr:selenophosphate synthetase, putative [Trypanosoma brucei brucei TREU927]Q38A34.1 RecName: Full=Selenide, water dikinase; AltName: Full=Selenophosphate synthetase 2; AltName: Full=TbSPS2; AltName: Full=TbselD [Trypanosoma brucei brucei TREU927]EAN78336.1 selenophosphate synthetase, putative [Trypanosoma brucei brucei TREU927]SCU65447.1 selenophosphate synthetase, putative [Trypanosoma equiperdum]